MYTCINCSMQVKELYRRYSPSVLKVLKCSNCGCLADKYIEYDPVIILVDLVLLEPQAYRHLLYNSNFRSYWKLLVVILLSESFCVWTNFGKSHGIYAENDDDENSIEFHKTDEFDGERSFYILLAHTGLSLTAFSLVIALGTEVRWLLTGKRPEKYKVTDLFRALIVGGSAKLLGLLSLVWQHVALDLHYMLIRSYTVLCILTAYSVVCQSGRIGSIIGLMIGLIAYNCVACSISWFPSAMTNTTFLVQEF